ncbi:hypothetical protein CK203_058710 [Vitis vinifera]|uniref:Uncharacterized protein n=1 Tax=Vitis vinifera TaxID=29760 RepID=A0A438GLJ7_VITVI|nr:hypothetical protein CK203_058710 [Vitis vinifera]
MTEPSQPLVVPPSVQGARLRRYEIRRPPTTPKVSSSQPKKSASLPPKKKARISTLVKPSKPQPPPIESQIPSRMTHEVIIRRPMVTKPPIEGNLDCLRLLSAYEYTSRPDPTIIHFTIDGRHGILGTRHIVEALCIPYVIRDLTREGAA